MQHQTIHLLQLLICFDGVSYHHKKVRFIFIYVPIFSLLINFLVPFHYNKFMFIFILIPFPSKLFNLYVFYNLNWVLPLESLNAIRNDVGILKKSVL